MLGRFISHTINYFALLYSQPMAATRRATSLLLGNISNDCVIPIFFSLSRSNEQRLIIIIRAYKRKPFFFLYSNVWQKKVALHTLVSQIYMKKSLVFLLFLLLSFFLVWGGMMDNSNDCLWLSSISIELITLTIRWDNTQTCRRRRRSNFRYFLFVRESNKWVPVSSRCHSDLSSSSILNFSFLYFSSSFIQIGYSRSVGWLATRLFRLLPIVVDSPSSWLQSKQTGNCFSIQPLLSILLSLSLSLPFGSYYSLPSAHTHTYCSSGTLAFVSRRHMNDTQRPKTHFLPSSSPYQMKFQTTRKLKIWKKKWENFFVRESTTLIRENFHPPAMPHRCGVERVGGWCVYIQCRMRVCG